MEGRGVGEGKKIMKEERKWKKETNVERREVEEEKEKKRSRRREVEEEK